MSLPPELMMQAEELDRTSEQMMDNLPLPQGKFSKNALNRLVGALNEVLKMFQDEYAMFEEDQTMLPQDFVEKMMMISSAAGDADVDFDISIGDISDDRDLALAAGKLSKLAKDKDFKRFLESSSLPGTKEEPMEEPMEEAMPKKEPVDMDAMFAGRM